MNEKSTATDRNDLRHLTKKIITKRKNCTANLSEKKEEANLFVSLWCENGTNYQMCAIVCPSRIFCSSL